MDRGKHSFAKMVFDVFVRDVKVDISFDSYFLCVVCLNLGILV